MKHVVLTLVLAVVLLGSLAANVAAQELQVGDLAPDFIGNEWHQRVEHSEYRFQHFNQCSSRAAFLRIGRLVRLQDRF